MLINENVFGQNIELETGNYYFSPQGVDKGTLLMLSKVQVTETDKVLDLGCGYGIVGIYIAKLIGGDRVVMSDILADAVQLSEDNLKRNAIEGVRLFQSDGLKDITDRDFTLILSNPPYHTDFSVAKAFIEDGFKRLVVGGRLMMVVKRLDWYKNKLAGVFGGIKVFEMDGYYILEAQKRTSHVEKSKKSKNMLSKKLQRKYIKQSATGHHKLKNML